jgi:predicted  nucleic acid-binding Zn-ribbon protein
MTEKAKKTFRISKDKNEKLSQLRSYFNRPFDAVLEQLIENAYLRMNEDLNANVTEELKETAVKMSFQYQQLAIEIGKLKGEIGTLRSDNSTLKDNLEKFDNELSGQKSRVEKFTVQVAQSIAKSSEREKNFKQGLKEVNDWIKTKDKSFVSKVMSLLEK